MNTKLDGLSISRRSFLAFAGAASGVALLVPRQILAQDDGLVQMARRSASSGNITVQNLRGKHQRPDGCRWKHRGFARP